MRKTCHEINNNRLSNGNERVVVDTTYLSFYHSHPHYTEAPKRSQAIFWLLSRQHVIRSRERVLNGVALDPFRARKQTENELKGLILITLVFTFLIYLTTLIMNAYACINHFLIFDDHCRFSTKESVKVWNISQFQSYCTFLRNQCIGLVLFKIILQKSHEVYTIKLVWCSEEESMPKFCIF